MQYKTRVLQWACCCKIRTAKRINQNSPFQTDRQTDRHLYLVIKLRVVPSGAKSNLLSTGALSTKIHYLHG